MTETDEIESRLKIVKELTLNINNARFWLKVGEQKLIEAEIIDA